MAREIPLAVMERPNGKPYHAILPPIPDEFTNVSTDADCVVVLRCTSDEVARKVAGPWIEARDLNPLIWRRAWWRLRPDGGEFDRLYVDDPVHGAPCIIFETFL